jgi:hypothetical protein
MSVYDTQCGAKLFRNTPETAALFEPSFVTNWSFDVEILSRIVAARRARPGPGMDEILYEVPLRTWRDTGVSKVRWLDFPRSLIELARIRWRYG